MKKEESVLGADGSPIAILTNEDLTITVKRPWAEVPRDPQPPWESTCLGIASTCYESADMMAYDERMAVRSKKYLTMVRPSDAKWIVDRLKDRIAGKVVVELGAGIGVMAVALAAHAKHVYAIEADPMWSWGFSRWLYQSKPHNLTFILDIAENLVETIHGDVALCVTGSNEVYLRSLCERFAPDVCMPWQDWNDGKAVVQGWHLQGLER